MLQTTNQTHRLSVVAVVVVHVRIVAVEVQVVRVVVVVRRRRPVVPVGTHVVHVSTVPVASSRKELFESIVSDTHTKKNVSEQAIMYFRFFSFSKRTDYQ